MSFKSRAYIKEIWKMYNFDDYTLMVCQTENQYYSKVPEHRFVAYLKEIPEASLHEYGANQIEAIESLREQFCFFQEECNEENISLPSPFRRGENKYSGRLPLRMPKWLHRDVALQANEEGLSQNSFIVHQLIKVVSVNSAQSLAEDAFKKILSDTLKSSPRVFAVEVTQSDALFASGMAHKIDNLSRLGGFRKFEKIHYTGM